MRFTTLIKLILSPNSLIKHYLHLKQIKPFKSKKVQIGIECIIQNTELGNNVSIGDYCSIINSIVGGRSYINTSSIIWNTTIGKYCSIGSHVNIGISTHPTNFVSTHPAFYSNNKIFETFADKMYVNEKVNIEIGNDVWIGSHSKILGNVRIGDGAIIALGAVVTKDVPPYAIVGGIPARIIKYRFDSEKINSLLISRWWELDDQWIKDNYKKFLDIDDFISNYKASTNK